MENSPGRQSPKRLRSSPPNGSSTDRISDLPNSIVQHILSYLPAKDAIKFCTLSRQWNSLWNSIPNLLFYCESTESKDIHRFASFVDQTVMLYASSKISKFLLDFRNDFALEDKLESWIRFATSHEVEELNLDLKLEHRLPGIFYAIPSVTNLSLSAANLYHYGERLGICWTSLKVLSLAQIRLEGGKIRSILLGSPLIECLTLRHCRFSKNDWGDKCMIDATGSSLEKLLLDSCSICHVCVPIEIKGPNLLSLTIVGRMGIKTLKLVDASSLVNATIDFWIDHSSEEKDLARHKKMLKGLLHKLRHVDKLTVGTRSLQVLSIMRADCAFFGTSRRKILKVDMKLNKEYLPGMMALLHSSADLKHLTINIIPLDDSEFKLAAVSENNHLAQENYWRSEMSTVKCFFRNLKSIHIVGFITGSCLSLEEIMVELVQFLLANAKVLQKMTIHAGPAHTLNKSWTSVQPEELFKLLGITQKLLYYPRASPSAVVEFKNYLN